MINNISKLFQIIYKNDNNLQMEEHPNTSYENCFMCDFDLEGSSQFTRNKICPQCQFHYTMTAKQRIDTLVDI